MMSKLQRKLRSRTGASMLLALVFLLFCMFIGSSVLASATSNAYRVAHLSDQQEFLNQRSAARLIVDELEGTGTRLRLNIQDADQTIQKVIVDDPGNVVPVGSPTYARTISFTAPSGLKMSTLQRIMYETAVLQYLAQNSVNTSSVALVFNNFVYTEGTNDITITSLEQFWLTEVNGELRIKGSVGTESFTEFTANYSSGTGEHLYDFVVDFGEFSQLSVTCNAAYGQKDSVTRVQIAKWNDGSSTYDAQITTESKQPVISWSSPLIEKGGA